MEGEKAVVRKGDEEFRIEARTVVFSVGQNPTMPWARSWRPRALRWKWWVIASSPAG